MIEPDRPYSFNGTRILQRITFLALITISPGLHAQQTGIKASANPDVVTGFRVRADFNIDLDEDSGWAAALNTAPPQVADVPFRIRFEVESTADRYRRQYSLQYRHNDGEWIYVEAHHFPYPSSASPVVSIVGCDAFTLGEAPDDLIPVSDKPADHGGGVTLSPTTPGWNPRPATGASAEWEWALVVRRWADGPEVVNHLDRFSLRMVDQFGRPLAGPPVEFQVHVPRRHLGGTFVETPANIGPFQSGNGDLYFIMEPTETDNRFMMVKSSDGGDSWFEVDGARRPKMSDLEGVGAVMSRDGIIHIVHQKSKAVYHHAFATNDHPQHKDQWITDSHLITTHDEPPTQTADIVLRPDGSLVSVFAAGDRLQYSICNRTGRWGKPEWLSHEASTGFTNPSLACQSDGTVIMAYKGQDGKLWSRKLLADNSLTPPRLVADGLGISESENISILPLLYLPKQKRTAAIFRKADGFLYMSFATESDVWSQPLKITDRKVVANAVDSDQVGAHAVVHQGNIVITFIDEKERDIYFLMLKDLDKVVSKPELLVSGIDGSWVRSSILKRGTSSVLGIIYDAGSKGGSGFNEFLAVDLAGE